MRYDRDEGFVQGAEFAPTERTEHVTRRRRLFRTRKRVEETSIKVSIIILLAYHLCSNYYSCLFM